MPDPLPWTRIDAVCLDLGGVVYLPDHARMLAALDRLGVVAEPHGLDRAHYAGAAATDDFTSDHSVWHAYNLGYARAHGVPDEHLDRAREVLLAAFEEGDVWTREIAGAREAIAALAARGVTIAIVSNADGTGTTLLLSEKSGSVVTQGYWDVCPTTATQFAYSGGSTAYAAGSSLPVPGFGVTGAAITPVLNSVVSGAPGAWSQPSSNHPDGVVVAFCDSHTLFLKTTIAPQVYAQLITSNNAKASSIPRSNWGTAAYALSDDDYQ